MNRNKITAVALATLTATILVSTSAFASSFSNNNHNGCGLEEVTNGHTYRYFIVNSKVIPKAKPAVIGETTFVASSDVLDALGIDDYSIDTNKGILKANIDGIEYVFECQSGKNYYYTKNGEKIYNKMKEQNGVKVPANNAINVIKNKKMYVPLSFFTEELGYSNAFTVSDTWDLTMGTGIKFNNTGMLATTESFTGEKFNKSKTLAEGWVCPTTNKVSTDNLSEDASILEQELEFDANGNISAVFNPQGLTGISVGPYATGSNASHFTNISVEGYGDTSNDAHLQINQMLPQVLKYYFPNSWEQVDSILKQKQNGTRYIIDGRDTVIEGSSGNISMSRVNGSLQGRLAELPVQGTIGSAYDVPTSDKGYWTQFGTQYWHYCDANNQFVHGWKQINGKWYFFDENGRMLSDVTVDGYQLDSDGAWIQ